MKPKLKKQTPFSIGVSIAVGLTAGLLVLIEDRKRQKRRRDMVATAIMLKK